MNEIILPFSAISYNTYYRIFRGRYVISKRGKEFRQQVKDALVGKPKTLGKVKLDIEFNFKARRTTSDLDNYLKAIIDAIKNEIIEDDSKIYSMSATKEYGIKNEIKIRITEMA
jgi:Holliday junction resolvase RusA-like endonuclease